MTIVIIILSLIIIISGLALVGRGVQVGNRVWGPNQARPFKKPSFSWTVSGMALMIGGAALFYSTLS
jgi:hypothetical protein